MANDEMSNDENGNKFKIDFDAVCRLIDLIKQSNIGRVSVKCGDFEIEVESNKTEKVVCSGVDSNFKLQAGEQAKAQGDDDLLSANFNKNESGNLVECPIVGTFYSAPSPGKPDFVKVGDSIKVGDVLFIVESMKIMNEVKSEFSGVVKKIFVKSGEPVEFGQSIMLIE